jgi:hypothetical protein
MHWEIFLLPGGQGSRELVIDLYPLVAPYWVANDELHSTFMII